MTDIAEFGEASVSAGDNFGLVAHTMEVLYPNRGRTRTLYGCYYLNPGGLLVTTERPGQVLLKVVGALHCAEIRSDNAIGDLQLKLVEDQHQSLRPPPAYPLSDRFHLVDWELTYPD